ncbi:MAG: plastocyanin/azurin family copper-binding protein, partial [Thermoproteota archaeon]|nr:plastocyanin/azurin family copper-binding protein [Thermoproteota archaeon]
DDVVKGAAFAVLATPDSTPDDHPAGTMVPPKGSPMVSGPPFEANQTGGAAAGTNATETGVEAGNATEAATVENATNQLLETSNATGGNATDLGAAAPDTAAQVGADTSGTEGGATETGGAAMSNTTGTEGGAEGGAAGTGASGGSTGVSIVPGASSLTTDAFQPNPIQVSTGATVTWTNNDSQPHTATSGENATPDQTFDSGIMAPAATFEHTFTEAGEYPYFCLLHPNMVGTVSVS